MRIGSETGADHHGLEFLRHGYDSAARPDVGISFTLLAENDGDYCV